MASNLSNMSDKFYSDQCRITQVRNATLMPSFRYLVILIAAVATLYGCATTTLERKTFSSYSVGREASATIGEAFLIDQKGSVEKVKTWVGILNSPDGWKVEERYSQDFVRKELL